MSCALHAGASLRTGDARRWLRFPAVELQIMVFAQLFRRDPHSSCRVEQERTRGYSGRDPRIRSPPKAALIAFRIAGN